MIDHLSLAVSDYDQSKLFYQGVLAPLGYTLLMEHPISVDEFYRTAISLGATSNGPPGVRTEYHPTYYGAFVLDPDGNNVEAVCHLAE